MFVLMIHLTDRADTNSKSQEATDLSLSVDRDQEAGILAEKILGQ